MDDDVANDAFSTLLNQIPTGMTVTRTAIKTLAAARVLRRIGEVEEPVKQDTEVFKRLLAELARDAMLLEDVVEVAAGRPGFSVERLDAILSEFVME